ncbi:hypothetical protein F4805DRAFT_415409, partial [Annulohypoxylon moriforme]
MLGYPFCTYRRLVWLGLSSISAALQYADSSADGFVWIVWMGGLGLHRHSNRAHKTIRLELFPCQPSHRDRRKI